MKAIRIIILAASVGFMTVACNSSSSEPEVPVENSSEPEVPVESSEEQMVFYEDPETPCVLSETQKQQIASINSFAFAFASKLDGRMGTAEYVFSPMSMAFLMGMLSEGAAGDTRDEICSALGFGAQGQNEFNKFCKEIMALTSKSQQGEVLEIANTAIVQNRFTMLDTYRQRAGDYYGALTVNMDFANDNVLDYINTWASEKTHGMIPKVLDQFDPSWLAVFMNALYFKAEWQYRFPVEFSSSRPFTGADGKKRKEVTMAMIEKAQYAKKDGFSALRMKYGRNGTPGNYSMVLLLPAEGSTVSKVLNSLNSQLWADILSSLNKQKVDIMIPRFNISTNNNVSDILMDLGVKKIFNSGDFSNMCEEELRIITIKQLAKISVQEKGTEAAAVSVAIGDGANFEQCPEFHADRPFVFAITEDSTGSILFIGSYK